MEQQNNIRMIKNVELSYQYKFLILKDRIPATVYPLRKYSIKDSFFLKIYSNHSLILYSIFVYRSH